MKTIKINVNGKETEITLTAEQLKQIETQNPMQKIYEYHNTTEKEFDKLYKDVSEFAKAHEVERMIVNYYNKGILPNLNDSNQPKYYPWFYLGEGFRYCCGCTWAAGSVASSRFFFLRREDLSEAVEVFKEQYKNSRNG